MENVARKPRHAFVSLWKLISSNRGINGPGVGSQGMLLSLLKETYHIILSSITIIVYNITLFEHCTRIDSKD